MSSTAPALDPAAVQQATGVPVLNPDTGDVHSIPTNMVDQARQAGGKPVAKMLDPTGTARWVSMDQVGDAQKAGGKLIPYGSQSSEQIVQDQTGIHPFQNPVAQAVAGGLRAAASPITGAYGAVKAAFSSPTSDEENAAQEAGGPMGLLADRAVIQPAQRAYQTAKGLYQQGHPLLAAGAMLGATPVLGPAGQGMGQRAAAGDIPGAVTEGLGTALMPAAMERAAPMVQKLPGVRGIVQNRTPVPGENFTPQQHASFAGVLARGSGAGKGYFPKDVATDIGSAARQAAADNPALNPATAETPEDSLARTQAVLQKVREGVDQKHAQALAPVANTPINPKPIQDAVSFPKSLQGFAPEDAAAVQDLKARLGNVTTLGGLNDLRQYLNTELASQFKMNTVAAGNSGAVTSAMQDALKATRNMYYDELQKASGQDFQGAKRMESSVLKAEEALGNAAPGMAARQAIAEQPRSIRGHAADIVQGAHTLKGGPVAGATQFIASKVLGETPMTPVQEGLKSFFGNLPPASPPQIVPAGGGVPRLLPAQPRLVAPAPQQLNAPAAPPYVGRPQILSPARPSLAPPPAPPMLEAGTGNPEFVTPPSSYPPLNEPTAQTSVNAGTPRPTQEEVPQRTIQVSPEGQAAIQRPALPAPESHAFSQKAWQAAHPNGNLKTAIKQAQARGYRVVE
jgi:hypothetical protein